MWNKITTLCSGQFKQVETCAKILPNYTAPPDLNKHSQLLHSARLNTCRFLCARRKRHKGSKMDQSQKKIALHLHLHLGWLFIPHARNGKRSPFQEILTSANSSTARPETYYSLVLSAVSCIVDGLRFDFCQQCVIRKKCIIVHAVVIPGPL